MAPTTSIRMAYFSRGGEIQVFNIYILFFQHTRKNYFLFFFYPTQVICGPMFAGKSTELIRRINKYRYAGRECLMIKHSCDVRYSDRKSINTHDKISFPALLTDSLSKIANQTESISVIGIDEGQFVSFFSKIFKI